VVPKKSLVAQKKRRRKVKCAVGNLRGTKEILKSCPLRRRSGRKKGHKKKENG